MKTDWKYIILYTCIALGLSFVVHSGLLDGIYKSVTKNTLLSDSTYLLAGFSTVIAAVIALLLHKPLPGSITILGNEPVKNVLIVCLPIVAFSIVGLNNTFGINKSAYGFSFAIVNTIYAFAEEFGWRRYLQNALAGLHKNVKYIFIGVVWWIWHFRFDTQFDIFIFPLICIGGGFLLGKLADQEKSILPVVCMHTLIILTTNVGNFGKRELIGIVIILIGWIGIEQLWKRNKRNHNPANNYENKEIKTD